MTKIEYLTRQWWAAEQARKAKLTELSRIWRSRLDAEEDSAECAAGHCSVARRLPNISDTYRRHRKRAGETVSDRDDFAVTAFDQSSQGGNHMKTNLKRRPNGELRTREYLTEAEVERLIKAAKANRHGHRDALMVLLAYRHGLRAAELVDLRWEQVELGRNAALHVQRVKQGLPSVHPLQGDEMRALRELKRQAASPYVFTSERGAPFTTAGFARMIERAGLAAKLGFKAHPHMLRHACGYALANAGHDTRALQAYLGHKNIQHTVRYTELSPTRFRDFWR